MKRYITISMIISMMFFITSCNENNSNEVNMIKDKVYLISKGQTIVKNEGNTIIRLNSKNDGITTATLVSGSASIK